MATINFDANKHSIEGKSQVVLRTNPALSSNVKLVVDSTGDIFLDSISANRTLSDQRYKKFELDPSGHYAYDLASFYAGTPLDTVYEPLRRDSDFSVYREYNKQYEEQYNYGARLNGSKLYDENIRFMAPLLINKQLPEYFVIYRIEEPVSETGLGDTLSSMNERIIDMLANATIVKTFDLRKSSKIGQYLERFANDDNRSSAPLTVSFESDEKTNWNGIDLRKGGFTSKGEYIYRDFTQTDREEIFNNQFITEGFKRNSIVSADLINLEFLFEDFDNPYEVNRYIGLYVTPHEEGSFKTINYKNEIITIDEDSLEVNFEIAPPLTATDMLPYTELEIPSLNWVKFNNTFSHIKNIRSGQALKPLQLKVNAFNSIAESPYILKEDTLRIRSVSDNSSDFIKLEIIDRPDSSDRITLATITEISAGNTIDDFTLYADSSLDAGTFSGTKYSNKGSLEQIAYALKTAMEAIIDQQFIITLQGTKIVINNYVSGNRVNNGFLSINNYNKVSFINIITANLNPGLNLSSVVPDDTVYGLTGGSSVGNVLLIDAEEIDDTEGDVYIKSGNTFAKIIETVEDPYYTGLYRVSLNKSIDKLLILDSAISLYKENRVYFGKFEALDFVDFDFDFFSTMHSQLKELEYEDSLTLNTHVLASQLVDLNTYNIPANNYFTTLQGAKEPVTPTSTGIITVDSEYDRLQENYIKETSLTSRVVPVINKWRYVDGVNAKENPYMLTVSEAFGKTNFAPDLKVDGRNPSAMTHEWYYIYGHSDYFDSTVNLADELDLITKTYSYLQPEKDITLDASKLMDVDNDWFNSLFVYEGYDIAGIGFAPAKISNKYTRFTRGSNVAPAEAMFRGLKVKAYARKEFSQTNPQNLINTAEFNNYKFSAVLNYKNEQSEDNVIIKAIQNKKFKALTLYIEVNTSDEVVSFVNRKLLYNLRDFVKSNGDPVDTQINGYIDFSIPQDPNNDKIIKGRGIGTDFVKDLQLNVDGSYNPLSFYYNNVKWVLPIISVDNANTITFASVGNYSIESDPKTPNGIFAVTTEPSGFWSNKTFTYTGGGYNLAKSTFESISAKAIADLLNSNDSERVEYITVEEDGTINTNRFILNVEEGNAFTKPSVLLPAADPNKPASYKVSSGKVGYVLEQRNDTYRAELIRMSGDYTPLTRTVVSFTDIYRPYKTTQIADDNDVTTVPDPREKALYERYHRKGIAFGSYQYEGYSKWGLIENAFYHKVNPEKADGILKLSNSTSSSPVYRLIDEIAIEKRDINVFRSSWEDNFYVKNGTKQTNQNVYGTLSTHEESAYLASTLNLPKDQYEITSYGDISKASSLDDMKAIKTGKNFKGDAVIFENNTTVFIDLYLGNLLVDLLEADNAGTSIKKYVVASQSYGDKTTLSDDIRKYIEVNLLKLMNATEIRVFNLESKLITESELLSATSLNDILDAGFKEDKSFTLEYDNTNPLNIKLIYNKRPGFRHQFYIYTKINS